jgi:hypothetical protein
LAVKLERLFELNLLVSANFIPFCLVDEQNLLLCMNITVTYKLVNFENTAWKPAFMDDAAIQP